MNWDWFTTAITPIVGPLMSFAVDTGSIAVEF